ncbi:hypothetical protein OG592_15270 [Streptomyces avidinii]|uniref:hypothetical protein n=1 Tax=Streptomyces avidinii TaxID=1895 RepID=UPI00386D6BC5|nr:hypothetical protein OG592_15270 [Streptomyces avidinii]
MKRRAVAPCCFPCWDGAWDSTPDAVDVSDTAMARRIVEEEQARLAAVGEQDAVPS